MLLPNKKSLTDNKFVQALFRFTNTNFVAKLIGIIVIWIVALIPTWFYIITRILIDPIGFWQEMALFCVFAVVIGWLQALLAIGGTILTIALMVEDW